MSQTTSQALPPVIPGNPGIPGTTGEKTTVQDQTTVPITQEQLDIYKTEAEKLGIPVALYNLYHGILPTPEEAEVLNQDTKFFVDTIQVGDNWFIMEKEKVLTPLARIVLDNPTKALKLQQAASVILNGEVAKLAYTPAGFIHKKVRDGYGPVFEAECYLHIATIPGYKIENDEIVPDENYKVVLVYNQYVADASEDDEMKKVFEI